MTTAAPTENRQWNQDLQLVAAIARLYPDERGLLAPLRRAAGKTLATAPDARWVYRLFAGYPNTEDDLLFLVATLIASHRPTLRKEQRKADGNLGWTMRMLQRDGGLSDSSADARMRKLLDARLDFGGTNELAHQLMGLVRLASGKGVSIDWPRLLADLRGWDRDDRKVQKAWARTYFTTAPKNEQPNTGEITATEGASDAD